MEGDRDISIGSDRPNIAVSGKRFTAWFMTPGVINYEDCKNGGQELLRKETIDEYLNSLIGAPLTMGHIPTSMTDFTDVSNGTVDKVGFDSAKGWHYCEGTVDTDNARNCIDDGWGISVGMRALEFAGGGNWLNNPYDREMKRIKFHHLALVSPDKKPRIDQSEVRLNSTTKTSMNIVKIIKKIAGRDGAASTVKTSELAIASKLDLGEGKSVTIAELIESERNNAVHSVCGDDEIEHEGVRYNCAELVKGYKERNNEGKMKGNTDETRVNAVETPERKVAREVSESAESIKTAKTALDAANAEVERVNAVKESTVDQIASAKTTAESAKTAYDAAITKGNEATERFNSLNAANAAETRRLADEKSKKDAADEKTRKDAADAVERENAARRSGADSFAIINAAAERGQTTGFKAIAKKTKGNSEESKRLFGSSQN